MILIFGLMTLMVLKIFSYLISLTCFIHRFLFDLAINNILSNLSSKVTHEMNQMLSNTFTKEEVIRALHQTPPSKAPASDGFSVLFFIKGIRALWVSKAFDHVEWNFLKNIMLKLGFSNNFVNLVMNCLGSVSFSILINGHPKGNFTPSRESFVKIILSYRIFFCYVRKGFLV